MPSEDRAALLERETRFTQEHAEIVKHFGQRYTKVAPIWAFQTDRPCTVATREGESQELPAGYFVATDGKTVWPVAADFMASSYALSTPAGTQDAEPDAWWAEYERLREEYAVRITRGRGETAACVALDTHVRSRLSSPVPERAPDGWLSMGGADGLSVQMWLEDAALARLLSISEWLHEHTLPIHIDTAGAPSTTQEVERG